MDRESRTQPILFLAGNTGESQAITTARAAWQSVHFSSAATAGTMTYEVYNEADDDWVTATDFEGSALPTVTIAASAVIPVDQHVNYCRTWRINMSTAQPDNSQVVIVHKV
jgi:hypothetical protein